MTNTILTTYPNLLKNYASYNSIISLLVTDRSRYNKMVSSEKFITSDWQIICKSSGVGPNRATGFTNTSTTYFNKDLYIDNLEINTIVGMNQENRGSNATDISLTIIEPFGMDFIEQLYDFCHDALNEKNYCQLPYLLKIEFKGYRDDGILESIPNTTKYIPIALITMETKVNNLGAIYKLSAVAYHELALTEQFGRNPTTLQLGSELDLALQGGLPVEFQNQIANGMQSSYLGSQVAHYAAQSTLNPQRTDQAANVAAGGIVSAVAHIDSGSTIHEITDAYIGLLNNIQESLYLNSYIGVKDTYSLTYSNILANGQTSEGGIGQYLYLELGTIVGSINNPSAAKDSIMGPPTVVENNQLNLTVESKRLSNYAIDPNTGTTGNGEVTYSQGGHAIVFNSGGSILDCLNTIIINSNYIISQINSYNNSLDQINSDIASAGLKSNSVIPPKIQEELNALHNTPFNWFKITPRITIGKWDGIRGTYAKNIEYNIRPYITYNVRSIEVPNGNPTTDNRVVKKYDYIFTGNNTEILSFDLTYNMAFLTYSQFNHNTKIQASGGKMPANTQQVPSLSQIGTVPSPISNGQSKTFVSSSDKSPSGAGVTTPERNMAADVASTIYSHQDNIELEMTIFGDPDFIRQDGIFLNLINNSDAFLNSSSTNTSQSVLFNTGEIYTLINFKIPRDINLQTGTLDKLFTSNTVDYRRNIFSGLYRIIYIDNKFDHGQFTQQLRLARYDDSHIYAIADNGF